MFDLAVQLWGRPSSVDALELQLSSSSGNVVVYKKNEGFYYIVNPLSSSVLKV